MAPELTYPHIEKPDGQPARLQGTPRVRVAQIAMDYLFHGMSVDEMCRQYPYLTPAEAHAAMAYYFDHQEEIAHEIETEARQVDDERGRLQPSALRLRLQALKRSRQGAMP